MIDVPFLCVHGTMKHVNLERSLWKAPQSPHSSAPAVLTSWRENEKGNSLIEMKGVSII